MSAPSNSFYRPRLSEASVNGDICRQEGRGFHDTSAGCILGELLIGKEAAQSIACRNWAKRPSRREIGRIAQGAGEALARCMQSFLVRALNGWAERHRVVQARSREGAKRTRAFHLHPRRQQKQLGRRLLFQI